MSKPNFTATIDFSHDGAYDTYFADQEEYDQWESLLRESSITVVLTRLKMQAMKLGLTEGEWARASLAQVSRTLRKTK